MRAGVVDEFLIGGADLVRKIAGEVGIEDPPADGVSSLLQSLRAQEKQDSEEAELGADVLGIGGMVLRGELAVGTFEVGARLGRALGAVEAVQRVVDALRQAIVLEERSERCTRGRKAIGHCDARK